MKMFSAPLFSLGVAICVHCFSCHLMAQSACGSMNVEFRVKSDSSRLEVPKEPPSGQALLFFIQETEGRIFGEKSSHIARIGIDGSWAGANHDGSDFSVPVVSGKHHLCANIQQVRDRVEFTSLEGEPGQVYYFRARLIETEGYVHLFFEQVDTDEGRALVAHSSRAISHPKDSR